MMESMKCGASIPALVLLCLFALQGHDCIQWSSTLNDRSVKLVCSGSVAILPWNEVHSPDEKVLDIKWYFEGKSGTKEMVAISANGNFFPSPSFSQRVSFVPNAGIALSHVTANDTGNYTVEVVGTNSTGQSFNLFKHSYLHVIDGVPTRDGNVQVTQQSQAVVNNVTGQWAVDLTCGTFIMPQGQLPPFNVAWETPSGAVVSSSNYSNGLFHLLLSQPIASGTYTCRLPDHNLCLQRNHIAGTTQASVQIDEMAAKLAILEAQSSNCSGSGSTPANTHAKNLTQQNADLVQQNAILAQTNVELVARNSNLTKLYNKLSRDNSDLSQRLQKLENLFNELNNTSALHAQSQSNDCCSKLDQKVEDLKRTMMNETIFLSKELINQQTHIGIVDQKCSSLNNRTFELQNHLQQMMTDQSNLTQQIGTLEKLLSSDPHSNSRGPVGFHARLCVNCHDSCRVNHYSTLRFHEVLYNSGQFNGTHFTAPESGVYFFQASSVMSSNSYGGLFLAKGGHTYLDYVRLNRGDAGQVHAAIHLQAGTSVSFKSSNNHDIYVLCSGTSFSGFLVSRD